MKSILIMTEGPSEKTFLDLLLRRNLLCFRKEDLFYHEIYFSRQIKGMLLANLESLSMQDKVVIIRVGDKMSDSLKIPPLIKPKIEREIKVCTLPEFEILMILKEDKWMEYQKNKSKEKPSDFIKVILPGYRKKSIQVLEYFSKLTDDEILNLLNDYCLKQGKVNYSHKCHTLKSLIREDLLLAKGISIENLEISEEDNERKIP